MARVTVYQREKFNDNNAENIEPEETRDPRLRGMRQPPPAMTIPDVDRLVTALTPRTRYLTNT